MTKLVMILMTCCLVHASAGTVAQNISLSVRNAPLVRVFDRIEKQAGVTFFASTEVLKNTNLVTLNLKNKTLEEVLQACFRNQPVTYVKDGKIITVIRAEDVTPTAPSRPVLTLDTPPIDIKGKIVNSKGEPAAGVTVAVKGSKRVTATDNNGEFILNDIDGQSTLIISGANVETLETSVNDKETIQITVTQKVSDLDEAVVVAYNTTTQRNNTGAVTVVKGEQIQNLPSRSVDKSLQGMVPGLLITNGSGQPGAGLSNMVLRGISTGTDAIAGETIRNPLIIIDGIPVTQDQFQVYTGINTTPITNPMAQLNPSDIESISVLKDAAAIALYGSKASNGVILITTKKGKSGKTMFSFRHQTDLANALNGKASTLTRNEYLDLLYQTYRNTDPTYWTDDLIRADLYTKFPTLISATGDTAFYPDSDVRSQVFTRNALTTANEIAMSGGSDISRFYLNLEYTKQHGAVKATGYDRKSMRFNFETKPVNNLKIGINTALSHNQQQYANALETAGSFASGSVSSPLNPVKLSTGEYPYIYSWGGIFGPYTNPVAEAELNSSSNTAFRALAKGYAELSLLKYFTLSSNIGGDFMLAEASEKTDPRFYASALFLPPPKITEQDTRRVSIITTNLLRFDKALSEQLRMNLQIGQEAQIITQRLLAAESVGNEETLPYYNELTSPGYTMDRTAGYSTRQTLASYFGQANISYRNRYLLSASSRRDGSSKFGDERRWGTYWSVGAGWLLSEEQLFKERFPWINHLKLRGSVGAAGNSAAIDAYTRFERISLLHYFDDNAVISSTTPANPDIQWEQTFSWDAGLETRLFHERLGVTVDVYKKKTSELIYLINLGSLSGYSSVLANIGDMENKGVELSLSGAIINSRDFKWNLRGNWSTNQNTLVKANVKLSELSGSTLGNEEGRNFNSFYMPVWAGVNIEDGRPQWLADDGKPTSNYAEAPKQFVGKPQPDGFGSVTSTFNYKGVELSAALYYQYGNSIYDITSSFPFLTDGAFPYANTTRYALEYWKKPGDVAPNPRRILNNPDGGSMTSTRYLYDGDYLRLQNVSLSYAFGEHLLKRLPVTLLRLYVQAHNVALLTKFKGPDPDNLTVGGSTSFAFPNQRTYSIGLNVNF